MDAVKKFVDDVYEKLMSNSTRSFQEILERELLASGLLKEPEIVIQPGQVWRHKSTGVLAACRRRFGNLEAVRLTGDDIYIMGPAESHAWLTEAELVYDPEETK